MRHNTVSAAGGLFEPQLSSPFPKLRGQTWVLAQPSSPSACWQATSDPCRAEPVGYKGATRKGKTHTEYLLSTIIFP